MTESIRLTHNRTGVVINVDPGTRATLDREWIEERDELEEFLTDLIEPTEPVAPAEPVEPDGSEELPEPPAGNASREEWVAFAKEIGITVDDSAKRDEIRAQVEQLLDAGDESGE